MSVIYVARDPNRGAFMLPGEGTPEHPMTLIPLYKLDRSALDEMVKAECQKQGLSEHDAEVLADAAEEQYEYRMKVKEAAAELRMRIREQARFSKLRWGGLRPPRKSSQHDAYR